MTDKNKIELFEDATVRSLTSKHSGSTIFINTEPALVTVELPPPEMGLHFTFIIKNTNTSAGNNFLLKSVNSSHVLTALIYVGQLANVACNTLTLASATKEHLSSNITCVSDGTYWHMAITSKTIGGFSAT